MLFRKRRPEGDSRPDPRAALNDMERAIYDAILAFPDRLDEMETRNEENCAALAKRVAEAVRTPGSEPKPR